LIVAGAILLTFPILVIAAPIIAKVAFHGFYSLTLDTLAAQELAAVGALGGAGFVGGLWMLSRARISN
jgi:hypothetical protein